jgi:hypothetical protein
MILVPIRKYTYVQWLTIDPQEHMGISTKSSAPPSE